MTRAHLKHPRRARPSDPRWIVRSEAPAARRSQPAGGFELRAQLGILFVAIATLGCKNTPQGTGIAIDAAAVNALVPAELKDKLVFEKTDIVLERGRHSTTYALAAPKGWARRNKMFGTLESPEREGPGFPSKLDVGSNCDGECKAKDWAQVADKVNFARRAKGKVLKDTKSDHDRTMIAENGRTTVVVHAWWAKGGSQYHVCTATLDGELGAAAPAFEKACQAISISGDD